MSNVNLDKPFPAILKFYFYLIGEILDAAHRITRFNQYMNQKQNVFMVKDSIIYLIELFKLIIQEQTCEWVIYLA